MGVRIELPRPIGGMFALAILLYVGWWAWTFNGSTGELNPHSRTRVLFPIWGNTALHSQGYAWAREGDTIVLDFDLRLDSGYFSLTVGKTRWPHRRLLRHEQSRSWRSSASGQLRYTVRQNGRHAIRAGTYSVWSGKARVRWAVVPAEAPVR